MLQERASVALMVLCIGSLILSSRNFIKFFRSFYKLILELNVIWNS